MAVKLINGKTHQRGQGMTEYIVIVALIGIAAISVVSLFGGAARNQIAGMAKELSGQSAAAQIGQATTAANDAALDAKDTKGLDKYNNK
ncbi:MAG: pilus assembly protein [Pseudomonadota bacterium]